MATKKEILQQLFEHEFNILKEGKMFSNHLNDLDHPFSSEYQNLLDHYQQLLQLAMKFTTISDNQINQLMDDSHINQNLEYLGYRDNLTNLYNRTYVKKILPTITVSNNEPLSCLYIDMNGLKLTNDVFGHQIGDQMIKSMAKILVSTCSENDIVVRWGGDEFLIIMPNSIIERAYNLKNKIKNSFITSELKLPIQLSAAIGIATITNFKDDLSELLHRAEQQMYKEKFLESSGIRLKIINELKKSLKTKSPIMHNHIKRVEKMAIAFALELDIHPRSLEMEKLKLLASLHDIGIVALEETHNFTKDLTSNYWATIRRCSEFGYRMAQALGETTVGYGILGLHEQWNGTGFPYGLKNEEIPFISRIISIVDTYDVLTHGIAATPPLSKEEAIEQMKQNSGKKFDPKLLDVFIHHFNKKR